MDQEFCFVSTCANDSTCSCGGCSNHCACKEQNKIKQRISINELFNTNSNEIKACHFDFEEEETEKKNTYYDEIAAMETFYDNEPLD